MKKSNQFEYKPSSGGTEHVEITLDFYADNNNLFLGMESYDAELKCMTPYTSITVNVIDLPYLYSAIDTNDNGEGIVPFLEENGFGEDTGKVISSAWCVYPLFKFNESALQQIAPYEFQKYQEAHGIESNPTGKQEKPLGEVAKEAKRRAAEKESARSDARQTHASHDVER